MQNVSVVKLRRHTLALIVMCSTLMLFDNCNGKQPNEPEYISQYEAKEIVITQILKGDTTSVQKAMISKEIVPPNTVVVPFEPQVITPEYKTWIVQLYYGVISEDEFDIQWVIINAKSGEYSIETHWYFRWSSDIDVGFCIFIS